MQIPPWLKATLLLFVTLGVGFTLGIGYERRRSLPHETGGSHHMVDRLATQLSLDSAQAAQVESILTRRQATVDSTWHAMRPHVRATMDSTLREIAAVLRPNQVARFRAMVGHLHPGALP